MKKSILYIILLFAAVYTTSCSNDFLEDNKKVIDGYELNDTIIISSEAGLNQINIQSIELKNNSSFAIVQYPHSLSLENSKGIITNNTLTIDYSFNGYITPNGQLTDIGYIIVNIDGLGYLKVNLATAYYGKPILQTDKDFIDFKESDVSIPLTIYNGSPDGVLKYSITKYPDWLSIDETQKQGTVYNYEIRPIYIRCNRYGLEPGKYSGNIEILNEITKEIKTIAVSVQITYYIKPETLINIEGIVTASKFDKTTNTIYIATHNPNKLIAYNIDSKSKKELSFENNINCISLSDDYKKIILGQSRKLSIVDTENLSLLNTYDLDFNVKDVVSDEVNCYITYKTNTIQYIRKIVVLNIETGQTSQIEDSDIFENANLFKIRNKPYFLATRETVLPNGIILYDISTGVPRVAKYWHKEEGNLFWFSDDQTYMYTQFGNIFKTPTIDSSTEISNLGTFKPSDSNEYSYYRYNWLDYNKATNSVWAAYNKNNPTVERNIILKFDATTYSRNSTIILTDYPYTVNNKTTYYPTNASYIFANKNGNKIVLVKNIEDPNINAWHLEVIDVTK